jgi:hypothetical protein
MSDGFDFDKKLGRSVRQFIWYLVSH